MSDLTWIELIHTSNRLDRFIQLCMIQAHRDFEKAEKDEFKKLYLNIKEDLEI